jgi:HD superfamily phosphohydrolase
MSNNPDKNAVGEEVKSEVADATGNKSLASNNLHPKKSTIIRDPIHGFIDLSYYDFISKIVQTAPFQRMRRLSQLGVSVFVYPSATHNRFNHSLGAMELFVRIFDHLYRDNKGDNDYEKLRKTGIASVLLHDIGHGPFSHASEDVFGFHHEDVSREIINSCEIKDFLQSFGILTNDIIDVITKKADGKMKLLSQLISSQLDVDRLDYLARDVYFTGVGFGGIDLDRIIRTMTISQEEGLLKDYAVIEEKGKHAVEAFLLTRNLMYDDVYHHKTTRCVEKIIEAIFKRVKELSDDGGASEFKLPKELEFIKKTKPGSSVNETEGLDILPLDDYYAYSLFQKWSREPETDAVLSDLSKRILERHLFKSEEIPPDQQLALTRQLNMIEDLVEKAGFNPEYYCILDSPKDRPYQPVHSATNDEEIEESLKNNIYVKHKGTRKVTEISVVSDVIKALTKRNQLMRLYFPEQVRLEVSNILKKIK